MIPKIDLRIGEYPRGLRVNLLAEPVELLDKRGIRLGIERHTIYVDQGLYRDAAAGEDCMLQGQVLHCRIEVPDSVLIRNIPTV